MLPAVINKKVFNQGYFLSNLYGRNLNEKNKYIPSIKKFFIIVVGIIIAVFLLKIFTALWGVDLSSILFRSVQAESLEQFKGLSEYLFYEKMEVIRQRISFGSPSNLVSLTDIG